MIKKTLPLMLAVIGVALAGCGGDDGANTTPTERQTFDQATAATIQGSVLFEGVPPAPTEIDMSADSRCGVTGQMASIYDVAVRDGKLANVFVYVSKGLEGKAYVPPTDTLLLDQVGCTYYPHVLGIMVGQPLRIRNSDETLHNVHALTKNSKLSFNFAQPKQGMEIVHSFNDTEVMAQVVCDVHGWMKSYIGILDHPCFAVSKDDGTFTFKAPPGEYTITAWHERLGTKEVTVTVAANETKDISFTFNAGS